MQRCHSLWLLAILLLVTRLTAQGPSHLPANFFDQKIEGNWNKPVGIAFDNAGHGFVWEVNGLVWRIDEQDQQMPTPLIDLSEEVLAAGDHGMLGMALHPNFLENGYIYLLYTVDRHYWTTFGTPAYDPSVMISKQATFGRVTRFQIDVNSDFTRLVPNSRKVILGDQPSNGIPILMESHGVGSLAFGNDGSLVVSTGDAGSYTELDEGNAADTYHVQALEDGIISETENIGAFRSLSVHSLNGKVLRIDPETGEGLASNPFF